MMAKESPTVIACGGTIESIALGDGTKQVVGGIQTLLPDAEIIRFKTAPSFTYTLKDFLAVAQLVHDHSSHGPPIVTTGTDTLEDLALVLDCLAPGSGVAVTGAAVDRDRDGADNLQAAVLAVNDPGWPMGVAVVAFAGKLRAGRHVEESAAPPDLFARSSAPPIGSSSDASVEWFESVQPLGISFPGEDLSRVGMVVSHPAAITAFNSLEAFDVVVVQGYGAGNVTPELWAILVDYLERGGVVVVCSANPAIPVGLVSRDVGGGALLMEKGAWSAGSLSFRKAALVTALAGSGRDARDRFDQLVTDLSVSGTS